MVKRWVLIGMAGMWVFCGSAMAFTCDDGRRCEEGSMYKGEEVLYISPDRLTIYVELPPKTKDEQLREREVSALERIADGMMKRR